MRVYMYHDRNEYLLEIKNLLTVHVSGDFFHMHNSDFNIFFDVQVIKTKSFVFIKILLRVHWEKMLQIFLTLEVLLNAHV